MFILILILTGIFFLINAIKKKMKNMAVLGFGVIAIPIGFIGNFLFNLGNLFQEYFVFFGFVSAIIFTNMTFYKGWIKKANIILIFVIILGIIQIMFYSMISEILMIAAQGKDILQTHCSGPQNVALDSYSVPIPAGHLYYRFQSLLHCKHSRANG